MFRKVIFLFLVCLLLATAAFAEAELRISGITDYMPEGARVTLSAEIDGEIASVEWSVNDTKLATISKTGNLVVRSAKKDNYVEVTCVSADGQTATKSFTVVPNATTMRMYNGENLCSAKELPVNIDDPNAFLQLTAKTVPENAALGVEWHSSDESVANVDENGRVTFLSSGRATITATTLNGRYTTCKILPYHNIKSIEIATPIIVPVGEKVKAVITTDPQIALSDPLEWMIESSRRAIIDETGTIKGLRAGVTSISCVSLNGVKAVAEIEVYMPVETVRTDKYEVLIGLNTSKKIEFKISPINAKYKDLTFETDDPEIATVSNDGTVSGVSEGTTVLRACALGGAFAEVKLNVEYVPLEKITFADEYITLAVSEEREPPLLYFPENASTHQCTLEIADESIAYFDENGRIIALSAGTTTVSVRPLGVTESTDTAILRVISSNDKPLEGLRIGVNPGHQLVSNYSQLPVAPGSRQTKNANSSGAMGVVTKIREYEANLQISLKLREALVNMGAEVVMTREQNDVKLTNIDRAQMLNDAKVNVALQIHNDSNDDKTKNGSAIYTKSEDKVSAAIAKYIINAMCEETGARNRGLKFYDLYMSLNWSETPAVLVECGYMTCPEEDRRLADPEYQKKLALGMAKGISYYYGFKGDFSALSDYFAD